MPAPDLRTVANALGAGVSLWLIGLVCGVAWADSAPRVSAHLGVASDYVAHGLTRSLSESVVRGQVGLAFDEGWSASIGASTLNLNPGPGVSRELNLYLGKRWDLPRDWSLSTSLSRYAFAPNRPILPYDYSELTLEASFREQLRLTVQYSPDYSIFSRRGPAREFATWNYELLGSYPLLRGLELSAGVGHYDLTAGLGRGYWFWSSGLVATRGPWSLAVSYIGTDAAAENMFGRNAARDRLVVALALRVR